MVKVYRSRYARLMVGPGEVFTPLPEPAGNARGELVTDDPGLQERLEHSAAFGIGREIWLHETDGQMEPPPPGGDVAEGYDAMTKARLLELAEIRCPGKVGPRSSKAEIIRALVDSASAGSELG